MLHPHHSSRGSSLSSIIRDEEQHELSSSSIPSLDREPVLVLHDSARDIVFRDHHAHHFVDSDDETDASTTTNNNVLSPHIVPLPAKPYGPADVFSPLLDSDPQQQSLTPQESHVHELLVQQKCVVKTIKNSEWSTFLDRFVHARDNRRHDAHADIPPPADATMNNNAFCTSTSLLPSSGYKMRCFGSTTQYTVGVVFALPDTADEEAEVTRTLTWSWPAGYAVRIIRHDGALSLVFVYRNHKRRSNNILYC